MTDLRQQTSDSARPYAKDEIRGIVLAAGASARMGRPKALLVRQGETFLTRAVRVLREGGCTDVLVVVNDREPEVRAQAQSIARVSVAPHSERAQPIDSLRVGLRGMPPDVSAVVILPVDCALVTATTVRTLIESFRSGTHAAAVPRWRNASGHPVLLGRDLFEEITQGSWPEGLRSLLHERAQDVAFVSVEDEGITIDIDTPEDARQRDVDL